MRPFRRGPNRGLRRGIEPDRNEEQRLQGIENLKTGKVPPPGPVTAAITSRRKASIKLASGPLANWIQSEKKSNTQG